MSKNNFDDILNSIGLGPWNLIHFLVLSISFLIIPAFVFSGVFIAPNMEFRCDPGNLNESIIMDEGQCFYTMNETTSLEGDNSTKESCSEWIYEDKYFTETLTKEFNLVCDRSYLRPMYLSIHVFGKLIGTPLNGFLSDRYGRKKLLTISSTVTMVSVFASSFSSNFYVILGLRVLVGLTMSPFTQTGYILCMEVCPMIHRTTVGILLSVPWAVGSVWWGILGYLIRDWRWLTRASTLPALLYFIGFLFIDESPRFNIVRGQHAEALKTIKRAAKLNSSTVPSDGELLKQMELIQKVWGEKMKAQQEASKRNSKNTKLKNFLFEVSKLFRTPQIRKITLLVYIVFTVSLFVFIGISLNAVNFKVNPFFYIAIGGLTEIPAYTLTIPIVKIFGRIRPTVVCYFVCGIAIIVLAFVPPEPKWLIILLAMIGKFGIASAFTLVYLTATESFPTEVRMQGLGTAAFVSTIGAIIAPYITDLLGEKYAWMPSLIFGCMSIVGGIGTIFIPETLNKHLPDTVLELEIEAKQNNKSFRSTTEEMTPMATDKV